MSLALETESDPFRGFGMVAAQGPATEVLPASVTDFSSSASHLRGLGFCCIALCVESAMYLSSSGVGDVSSAQRAALVPNSET